MRESQPLTPRLASDAERGAAAAPSPWITTRAVTSGFAAVLLLAACGVIAVYGEGGVSLPRALTLSVATARGRGRLAALGDINLDCPAGMFAPRSRGPNADKFTSITIGLSRYADRIYIICTDHCDMDIPEEFDDKVMMLDGFELDKCNGLGGYDHWIKASQAHLHAVTHALSVDSETAMILEQDTISDPNVVWADGNWQQLNDAMENHQWFMIRMGYRPINFEYNPTIEECPQPCACEDAGEMLCWLEGTGCDLHASDAYLLHRRGMLQYAQSLTGGAVIDNGVLQGLPNQLVLTPQLNYQTEASSDFTSMEHQQDVQAIFMERCKLGLTGTQAREAMAELARQDTQEPSLGKVSGRDDARRTYADMKLYLDVKNRTSGESVSTYSAVRGFGGLEKLRASKRRLGVPEI